MIPPSHLRPRQRGFALIAIFSIVGVIGLFFVVSALSSNQLHSKRNATTAAALAQAKEALIGRAVADINRPGSLPCPDLMTNIPGNNIPGDGKADMLVGNDCPSYVGWLPWQTLGLPDLRDDAGERLWYALSRSLRDDNSAQPINSSTAGNLSLDSTSQVAAIIFAPGMPLSGQSRPSTNVSDYLDGTNAIPNQVNYVSGPPGASFNDRALALTRDELFQAVGRRVLAEVRGNSLYGLQNYYATSTKYPLPASSALLGLPDQLPGTTGFVPYNAPLSFASAALANNNWFSLVSYYVNGSQTQATLGIALPSAINCTVIPSQANCQ